MKVRNNIFIVSTLLILCSSYAWSQKVVTLKQQSKRCLDCYDVRDAMMKVIANNDTFLLSKTDSFKFELPDSFFLVAQEIKQMKFLVETGKQIFVFEIDKKTWFENYGFSFVLYKIDDGSNASISYDTPSGKMRISRPLGMKVLEKPDQK